jgi:hypothetical protein
VGWSRCTRLDRRPAFGRGVRCSCRVQCCRTRGEASIRPLHREGCLLSSTSTAHEVTTPGAHGGLCPPAADTRGTSDSAVRDGFNPGPVPLRHPVRLLVRASFDLGPQPTSQPTPGLSGNLFNFLGRLGDQLGRQTYSARRSDPGRFFSLLLRSDPALSGILWGHISRL